MLVEAIARFDPSLEVLLAGFLVLIVFQAVLVRTKAVYLTTVIHEAVDQLKQRFFANAGSARWDTLQTTRVSDLQAMITMEAGRTLMAAQALTTLLQSGILLLTYFALAAVVSWPMALTAAAFGVVILLLLLPLRRRATLYGRDLTNLYRGENHTLLDFLTVLKVA